MDSNSGHRRKQFSSCDACRRSRVACDAMRGRSVRGNASIATCTRCLRTKRTCSFEWMNRPSPRSNRDSPFADGFVDFSRMHHPTSPVPRSLAESAVGQERDGRETCIATPALSFPVEPDVEDWLRSAYEDIFEEVFGTWLGNYSCPFVFGEHGQLDNTSSNQTPLALSVSISTLCRQCDLRIKELQNYETSTVPNQTTFEVGIQREREIDHTLNQAIQMFSARWLSLTSQSNINQTDYTVLIQRSWRELRKSLLKAINRPCYRSMWSLYLFAMVPIPIGIPEEEEEDGISALFCVQAALQHVLQLRARQRSVEFNGSKVSPLQTRATSISSPGDLRADFLNIESMIYWAALTFDTSSSLTFNTKSVLSSGLLGWESESSWRLVKSCRDIFHEETEDWRINGVIMTEENANRVIAAAAAWKLHVWKLAAVLKEALREGHEEDAVHHAYMSAATAIKQFNITYRPLLEACQRRIQFLSQHTKLRWYEVMLHYHLSILIMIDAIETASRTDILGQINITKSEIEGNTLNCLVFGLENKFAIPKRLDENPTNSIEVPLVAIDPYPHHVVAAVQLLWKGTEKDYETNRLDISTLKHVQSLLLKTLQLLPQSSKSVCSAREQAQKSVERYKNTFSYAV